MAADAHRLYLTGVGITNDSGVVQTFKAAHDLSIEGTIQFSGSATAGSLTAFFHNSVASTVFYDQSNASNASFANEVGSTRFNDDASAANGIFSNNTTGGTHFSGHSTAANGTFSSNGDVSFTDNATAANGTFTSEGEVDGHEGLIEFYDETTAGDATFINNGGTVRGAKGALFFFSGDSNAGNGTFINNGGEVSGSFGSLIKFVDASTADHATFTCNGGEASGASGGLVIFSDSSTAANATLIANGSVSGGEGGTISFRLMSAGGEARVQAYDNGKLDIVQYNAPALTIGSLEGDGPMFLGSYNLTVGSNNLTSSFGDVIQDGGSVGGTGGSVTKIGSGTLTVKGVSTYTGGTTVEEGTLLVETANGSATGTGPVQVNGGTFGGRSNIAGAVTIGNDSGSVGQLAPGVQGPGILVIKNTLTFTAHGIYNCDLNTVTVKADQVTAKGVTIESGAQFALLAKGNQILPPGTVLTIVDNRSPRPISGTFGNLPDGSTFTANGNTFQANYEGGDGNDLTLTVQ